MKGIVWKLFENEFRKLSGNEFEFFSQNRGNESYTTNLVQAFSSIALEKKRLHLFNSRPYLTIN